jgi:hypothetical protein
VNEGRGHGKQVLADNDEGTGSENNGNAVVSTDHDVLGQGLDNNNADQAVEMY